MARAPQPVAGGANERRVLILGGGFAGVYAALGLERALRASDRTTVTLVSAENYFLFTPLLCEVASGSIETSHAINPLRRLFRRVHFVEGEVIGTDLEHRTVLVRHPGGREDHYGYDHLVMALGARTSFFGLEEVEAHARTAKNLADAISLRNRVIEVLEQAEIEADLAERTALVTLVVVGGGLTGVELAGELNDLLGQAASLYPRLAPVRPRVLLLESASRLMPELDDRLARFALRRLRASGVEVHLQTRVTGADARQVRLKDHDPIPTRTLIWTAGVAPHPIVEASTLPKQGRGWVRVDPQLRGDGLPDLWALGDCAQVPDVLRPGQYHPATAQHAIREAALLARNLVATLRGEPMQPFRYRTLGQMATLGHHNGVGVIGPLRVWGFLAWALWRTYYLWRLPRLDKRLRVATDWALDLLFGRDISQIQSFSKAGQQGDM
jgi:NADH dehydrogenase